MDSGAAGGAGGDGAGGVVWRTERLRLRLCALGEEHRRGWVGAHAVSEELFARWMPLPEPGLSLDERFDAALARAAEGLRAGTAYRLVALTDDGTLVGGFNLNNVVRGVFQNADAGWWVRADLQRRGYATEGVRGLLGFAFAPADGSGGPAGAGLHRVQANIIPGNAASLRVAERAGFRREGYARAMLKIAGRWQDHIMFAKLAEEHAARAGPEGGLSDAAQSGASRSSSENR